MSDVAEGTTVDLTFVRESRVTRRESRTITSEVLAVEGEIVTLANPYGENGPRVVVDPDGDVWARSEDGSDGYYGTNARFE